MGKGSLNLARINLSSNTLVGFLPIQNFMQRFCCFSKYMFCATLNTASQMFVMCLCIVVCGLRLRYLFLILHARVSAGSCL